MNIAIYKIVPMTIQKRSILTGRINEMEINLSQDQLNRINAGEELIQHICPNLSADEREFLINGITPEEA